MSAVLNKILEPLAKYYSDPSVIEIRMKQPGVVVLEIRDTGLEEIQDPTLTLHVLEMICQSLSNKDGLSFHTEQHPQLSTILPEGHRFECLLGPSVRGGVSLAIRTKHPFTVPWEAFGVEGPLLDYVKKLANPVADVRKKIIVSGGTNTGKTTFINKFLSLYPDDTRVVGAEDTPEIELSRFWNGASLIASRNGVAGNGMMDWGNNYDHTLRISPEIIVVGEISISNAFIGLSYLNAGNFGFMCSIHADSPEQVINRKFDQNIAFNGKQIPRISDYMKDLVDCIIQIKRGKNGARKITDIWEPINNRHIMKEGEILI